MRRTVCFGFGLLTIGFAGGEQDSGFQYMKTTHPQEHEPHSPKIISFMQQTLKTTLQGGGGKGFGLLEIYWKYQYNISAVKNFSTKFV